MVRTHNAGLFLNINAHTDDSQRVSKLEDLKELSTELSRLRKNHDSVRARNLSRELQLEQLQQELTSLSKVGCRTGAKRDQLRETAQAKAAALDSLLREKEDAVLTGQVYERMIERMQLEKLDLDRRTYELNAQLRQMDTLLSGEREKQSRKREDAIHTRQACAFLEQFVQRERQEARGNLETIERDVVKKLETTQKRSERQQRQLEISERAANEEKDRSATDLRNKLLLSRLWSALLRNKLATLTR